MTEESKSEISLEANVVQTGVDVGRDYRLQDDGGDGNRGIQSCQSAGTP